MLSDNLKKLRLARGMSQEELASRLNVVRQTVSKWEKGLSIPDADMIIKLSEIFGVKAGELLGEKNALVENVKKQKVAKGGYCILRTIGRFLLGVLICYLIFLIIQTVLGFGASVNTDITESVVPL